MWEVHIEHRKVGVGRRRKKIIAKSDDLQEQSCVPSGLCSSGVQEEATSEAESQVGVVGARGWEGAQSCAKCGSRGSWSSDEEGWGLESLRKQAAQSHAMCDCNPKASKWALSLSDKSQWFLSLAGLVVGEGGRRRSLCGRCVRVAVESSTCRSGVASPRASALVPCCKSWR